MSMIMKLPQWTSLKIEISYERIVPPMTQNGRRYEWGSVMK